MWRSLVGTRVEYAGTSGTVALAAGAFVTHIMAHASAGGASVAILGGTAIPIINGADPLVLQFHDDGTQANLASSSIVFTGTDSYYVRAFKPGHT